MKALDDLLQKITSGEIAGADAVQAIRQAYFADLEHATLDLSREARTGAAEVIYCAGKSPQQVADIFRSMLQHGQDILATRADAACWAAVQSVEPSARYHESAQVITHRKNTDAQRAGMIAVVAAGTSDLRVADEAAVTAEFYGNPVLRVTDVGVAGIHRLFDRLPEIRTARVIIAVAGMEGALPSVLGGLVSCPVIAVPTSVGYGANLGGIATLLAMLNSCTPGISVVNIDNGFGAGYLAARINAL